VEGISELAEGPCQAGIRGVVFANELLDAFPVHRLVWDARQRRWFELGVTLRQGQFDWTRLERQDLPSGHPESPLSGLQILPSPPAELAAILPEGFILDFCPAASSWWREAAAALACGRLVTIDYGLTAESMLSPERKEGTLRAYSGHQQSRDLLGKPGGQDLTAHVDFSALQAAGEAAGLETETLETQGRFLTRLAAGIWEGSARFEAWTSKHNRQFLTLTHPEHLGGRFRVLIQRTHAADAGVRNGE